MIKIKNLDTRRKAVMLSVVFLQLFVFPSCKKKDSDLGLDLTGTNALGLNTVDTFEIRTYCELQDSVNSSNKTANLLGSYQDPKFGTVDYATVTQILLSSNNPNFGDVGLIHIDSVVLALKYISVGGVNKYGEDGAQTFEVYELDEDLSLDSTYYTFSQVLTKPTNLVEAGSGTITPQPYLDAIVGEDTLEPQLRIRLDTNLGWQLINAQANGDLLDNTTFKSFFKGLQIKVNNGIQSNNEGAIYYFDLTDLSSKLTIYYKEDTIAKTFDFTIDSDNAARFTQANFDISGTYLDQVLNDTLSGEYEFYYQANHIWGAIEFPDLLGIKNNQGLIVNKAELIIPTQFYPADELFAPQTMFLLYKDSLGKDFLTPDYTNPDGAYYENEGAYKFIVTRYLQRVLSGEYPNAGLRITNADFFSTANRVVFNGSQTTNKVKPRLIITYSNY
ncbi:MAG: DUF4270 family protein [Crocinitomicaceae bacterium]